MASEFITGIASQPDFPQTDLSDSNAELLELMMANQSIVREMHAGIEQLSWTFRVGHTATLVNVSRVHDEHERLVAVDHGVATFEAITPMVGGIALVSDTTHVNRQATRLARLDGRKIEEYFDESLDTFTVAMPNTAEVVRRSTSRFVGPLYSYALLGAAISRRFDLDCAA